MSNRSLEEAYAYAAPLQSTAARPTLPRHIRRSEFRQVVPLGDTAIYQMEQRGEFPKRFYLTPVWDLAEVEVWIEQRRRASASGSKFPGPDVRKRKSRPVRKL
jgi:prophage regulatory protein